MISKNELDLFEIGYKLSENRIVNDKVEVRLYTSNRKKDIICIYNDNSKSSVLLYNSTIKEVIKICSSLIQKRKTGTKRKK